MIVNRLFAWGLISALLMLTPATRVDPIRDGQWYLSYLNIGQAHAITEGAGVTVAVVDTGADANHPDLAGSLATGTDFVKAGDGRVDTDGHGTHMAGLIAAHGQALGIAPRAMIMSIRASEASTGGGFTSQGIDWAVDHRADVICVATGAADSPGLRRTITRALEQDIVVVAAAGNTPQDRTVQYPAAYDGVIAAGGIDRNGNHASIAVTGPEVILAAPAMEIVAPYRTGQGSTGYVQTNGTSDATAIIAGAAALVRSKFPNLSGPEVVHRLTATADDKGAPGRDVEYGYGVLNIVKALTADVPPLTTTAAQPSTTTTNEAQPPAEEGKNGLLFVIGGIVLLLLIGAAGVLWQRARR